MKEELSFLTNLPWKEVWHILKDIVLPHSGTLIINMVLLLVIGFTISLFYIIILSKRKIFKRIPKYYNWAVKLYIPILILSFLYIFGQLGFIRGVYKILHKEQPRVVSGIYDQALGLYFESEENKNNAIRKIQSMAIEAKDGSLEFTKQLKDFNKKHQTGVAVIDQSKDKITNYILSSHGEQIYKLGLYGMLSATGTHIDFNETIPYDVFSKGMDFLLNVGHKDIELAILDKLNYGVDYLLSYQYKGMVKSLLTILLLIMLFPLLEYYVYKIWIEKKYL